VAGPAPDLEDPCAGGGDRRDAGGNAVGERAEQEPAQGVVDASMANEDASCYPVTLGGPAAVAHDRDGGGRTGQDGERSRSDHHASSR
jgi:hypothetical protein